MSNSKSRRLLIANGCGSRVAQQTLPEFTGYDDYFLLSRTEGRINIGGQDRLIFGSNNNENSFSNNSTQIEFGVKINEFDVIDAVCFIGVKDTAIFTKINSEEIARLIEVNITDVVLWVQKLIKSCLGKKLSIVLISSSGALQGDAGVSIYSLSKHALNGLVRCLALEYGRFGVHINIVALGVMEDGISSDVPPSRLKSMLDRTANRSVVTPTDLAQSVKLLFLNKGINGSTVYCDGGYF
jgi:hypothetical protein